MLEQNYSEAIVRSSAILTGSYVAGTVIGTLSAFSRTELNNQLLLYISFTKGSLTSAEVKIEYSADATTYYQETYSAISGATSTDTIGEHTMTATGNYRLAIPIKDRFIKVSAKGTGTTTNSLMAILAVIGIA